MFGSPTQKKQNRSTTSTPRENVEETKQAKSRFKGVLKKIFSSKITTVDKIFFMQNLEVLVRAGFSLSQALNTLSSQIKKKNFRLVVMDVAKEVENGATFAAGLRKYHHNFGELFINMIESGEISGKLEITIRELTTQLKRTHFLFLKVRNALAYPAVILVGMIAVGTGMMIFVIPKIVEMYSGTDIQLPFATRLIVAISNFVLQNGIISGVLTVITIALLFFLYRRPSVKFHFHKLFLRLPIIGRIILEYNLARFHRVFHTLLTTDIPIVLAFQIISNTMGNLAYKKFLQHYSQELEKGVTIAEQLKKNERLFPSTVTAMISVAETSGTLEEMTLDIAEHYEQEVSSALDALSVLIEPVLMLLLGIATAIIAVAVLWPMYNLVNVI